jgi:hypothetical protein
VKGAQDNPAGGKKEEGAPDEKEADEMGIGSTKGS